MTVVNHGVVEPLNKEREGGQELLRQLQATRTLPLTDDKELYNDHFETLKDSCVLISDAHVTVLANDEKKVLWWTRLDQLASARADGDKLTLNRTNAPAAARPNGSAVAWSARLRSERDASTAAACVVALVRTGIDEPLVAAVEGGHLVPAGTGVEAPAEGATGGIVGPVIRGRRRRRAFACCGGPPASP